MGIITLVANTSAYIWPKKNRPSWVRISSDSATMTRICKTEEDTQLPGAGEILIAYQDKKYYIPEGVDLFAISTGTPNISIHDVTEEYNLMRRPR